MGMWFAPKDSGQFSANFDKQTDFDHRKNPFNMTVIELNLLRMVSFNQEGELTIDLSLCVHPHDYQNISSL